jgi:hypothetical protein
MRRLRALIPQSPALVISLLALIFSLSGGAYAATAMTQHNTVRPAASRGRVTMHALHLVNGWKSAAKTSYKSGAPSYGVSNGVVYLSGGMYQPIQGKAQFATLPKRYRPSTNLFITVSVAEGVTNFGTLFISPKGVMEVYDPAGANTPVSDFTALSGVSFPLGS